MKSEPLFLSIVLPSHNEAEAIPALLSRLEGAIAHLRERALISDVQVLIVDDASEDQTSLVLQSYPWVQTLRLERRSGYGAALKAGFRAASGSVVAFLDLDETYDPSDLTRLIELIQTGHVDLVMGDRLTCGEGMSWIRSVGNRFFSALVRLLLRQTIRDACTGYRVFRRSLVSEICALEADGLNFSLSISLWALRRNISFCEIPVSYRTRTGRSKLRIFGDGWIFLWTILKNQMDGLPSRSRWLSRES